MAGRQVAASEQRVKRVAQLRMFQISTPGSPLQLEAELLRYVCIECDPYASGRIGRSIRKHTKVLG